MGKERPYRLALLGTSPTLAGEADLPFLKASPVRTGEGDRLRWKGRLGLCRKYTASDETSYEQETGIYI